jgi:hypothetical protein
MPCWRGAFLGTRACSRPLEAHLVTAVIRPTHLARLLALAHRFDKLLRDGMVHNLKTLARLGHVSPARISQILSLLHLAPDIQEALLFRSRPEHGRDCLDMRRVLPLTKIVDWQEQRRLWRRLAEVRQRA